MAIDTRTPLSPGWWMVQLARELAAQRKRCDYLDSYYSGRPPMPYGGEKWTQSFQSFMRKARSNFAAVIVQTPRERLAVRAIRTKTDNDDDGDQTAWDMWTGNDLDVHQADVYRYALSMHVGYVSVGMPEPDSETPTLPVIVAEDPRNTITVHDPVTRREIAAFKLYHDPLEHRDYAMLWLPGQLYVATRDRTHRGAGTVLATAYNQSLTPTGPIPVTFSATSFTLENEDGSPSAEWSSKTVPVTRFLNRDGKAEFEDHIDLLDRINHMILQRLVIATLQAFRQRAIETTDPEGLADEDDDGEPIDWDKMFTADPGALWRMPFGARVWESQQVDLSGILNAVKDDVLHLAALTATPLSMFTPDAATQTAEGASLQREGQTYKVVDRQRIFGRSWARVMSHAFMFSGDAERADLGSITIDWMPAERYSLAEKGAAAAQLAAVLPHEVIWREVMQFTPPQIALAKSAQADDQALAAANAQIATEQAARVAAAQQPAPAPGGPQPPAPAPGGPKPAPAPIRSSQRHPPAPTPAPVPAKT